MSFSADKVKKETDDLIKDTKESLREALYKVSVEAPEKYDEVKQHAKEGLELLYQKGQYVQDQAEQRSFENRDKLMHEAEMERIRANKAKLEEKRDQSQPEVIAEGSISPTEKLEASSDATKAPEVKEKKIRWESTESPNIQSIVEQTERLKTSEDESPATIRQGEIPSIPLEHQETTQPSPQSATGGFFSMIKETAISGLEKMPIIGTVVERVVGTTSPEAKSAQEIETEKVRLAAMGGDLPHTSVTTQVGELKGQASQLEKQ